MIGRLKVVVVMPAYNAEATLRRTHREIPFGLVDEVILVDDASSDHTARVARNLGIRTIVHPENRGYGGNQKTCYRTALQRGADIVVMLHPDYQYTPKLIPAMAHLLASGEYDVVLGSRILGGRALEGGMPAYKYVFNRALTFIQNLLMGSKLSEFHTGYRAFTKKALRAVPWQGNSDDFVFDGQMLAQVIHKGLKVGEITCPAKYFPEASSINFRRSVVYGLGCVGTALRFRLDKWGLWKSPLFKNNKK